MRQIEQPKTAAGTGDTERRDVEGDVFIVDKDVLQIDREEIYEIWLTNLKKDYNENDKKKRSFITLWITEHVGDEIGKRSKPMHVLEP